MTIHIDMTAAEQSVQICGILRKGSTVPSSAWRSLYRTEGVKTLTESGFRKNREIRVYLESLGREGEERTLPDSHGLETLKNGAEEAGREVISEAAHWLTPAAGGKDVTICLALFGDGAEDSDPPVMDASYACSLGPADLKRQVAKLILTCLLKRHQNLERYYLKNFLPIRRHMDFIYALWEIQINGLVSLLAEEDVKGEEDFSAMETLLAAAARADRKGLVQLGRQFREEVDTEAAGRNLYRRWEGDPEAIGDTLAKPTAPFLLLRRKGEDIFSPEASFFLDQLDSLLS